MTIAREARRVATLLATKRQKVAFAESCTGGLVSGALTAIPGISAWHCGGVVVYRNETKHALLKIPPRLLANPGPVSEPVARKMATVVLDLIPEATISVAVTGHLGPSAPPELDGLVFLAVAARQTPKSPTGKAPVKVIVQKHLLPPDDRLKRQKIVVAAALRLLADSLQSLE